MDEFTFDIGRGWRTRLWGRNRLVRSSDRLEAFATSLFALILMMSIPIAAAVSTSVHDTLAAEYAQRAATSHSITAVATADSVRIPQPFATNWTTRAQWRFDGETRTDVVVSDRKLSAGQDVDIWIDARGAHVPAPPGRSQAGIGAAWAGITLWLGVGAAGMALLQILRNGLNRRRYAEWDKDLAELAGGGGNHSKWR